MEENTIQENSLMGALEKDYMYKSSYRFRPLPACTLKLEDFKKLFEKLKVHTDEGAKIEIAEIQKKPEEIQEQFIQRVQLAKGLFKVSVQIFGAKGEYICKESSNIFDDANLPDTITKITFDNTTRFQAIMQREPKNRFRIEFDFTKQEVFDLLSLPSASTVNKSTLNILGENDSWVSGTYNNIIEFLQERHNKYGWLHRRNIYDIFLFVLIAPLSLRLLYLISRFLPPQFSNLPSFFKFACYFYLFLIIANIFRILFNYARWLFPLVELVSQTPKGAIKHRIIFSGILFAILLPIVSDFLKFLFNAIFK